MLVLDQRAVVVVVSLLDGSSVDCGLLQGGVRPTEPRQRRDGLGDDYEQRQHMRGHSPQWSEIEEGRMERSS